MNKRDDIFISQIRERISRIKRFIDGATERKFRASEMLQAAVMRELEVIGEAARLISPETKAKSPDIPWAQMTAMRNRLIHGYFAVDLSIVWEVARKNLASLDLGLERAHAEAAPTIHPWRRCPEGYYFVRPFDRKVLENSDHPEGLTSVTQHCRRNPSGKDQLHAEEIKAMTQAHSVEREVARLNKPSQANDFDGQVLTWVTYWNEILGTRDSPLTAEIMKALIMSESSFRNSATHVSGRNYARGLTQVTDVTRRIMANEKGELKNHYLVLSAKDLNDPAIAICAAVRWLHHKKSLAASYLNREATWPEAVAEYKSYLRRGKWKLAKGMQNFKKALVEMGQPTWE